MLTDYLAGLRAYFDVLSLFGRYRLWPYMLIPMLIALAIGGGFLAVAWGISDDIGHWLISFYPWDWGSSVVEKIAEVFGGIAVVAIGFILIKHLTMAIASPFMSMLSERIEKQEMASPDPTMSIGLFFSQMVRGLRIALRNIVRELFFTILLLLLGLIPLFTPFTTILIFLVQAYYAGFGSMDYTLERYGNVRESVRFVRRNRGFALGNGTVFMLLFLTGVGFLFALPLSTAAATPGTLRRL